MAARLKVFVTSDGLTDYVVATSSRAKALAAWGIRQDAFKEGAAHETDDQALVKAATARPGEVLRRAAGSRGELAKLKPAKPPKPSGPTKAQLKRVSELEARLAGLDAEHAKARAAIESERAALERRLQAIEARRDARRDKLEAALSEARSAIE
ncbi:MAG TPA: hypothetical protein VIE16_00235 [Phenylobacterium sp.]|jgi:hypothetical protein